MLEEHTTPNDRNDGVILVAFGGGNPGGVEGLRSSFVFEVESSCDTDMFVWTPIFKSKTCLCLLVVGTPGGYCCLLISTVVFFLFFLVSSRALQVRVLRYFFRRRRAVQKD